MYATFYYILSGVAKDYGYALAMHGSVERDLDLVCVPWVEDAKDYTDMIEAMREAIGGFLMKNHLPKPGDKPHGRMCFLIQTGGGGYLDISVFPPMK